MTRHTVKKLVSLLFATAALTLTVLLPASSGAVNSLAEDAAKTFEAKCSKCHGLDGTGTDMGKKMKAPDLTSAAVQKKPDDQLIERIARGEKSFHKFEKSLTADQIKQLAAHVRKLGKK